MPTAESSTASQNPFDSKGSFLLSLYMTLVGYSVLVALPAINSAWVDQLGFSDVEVNRVASSDLLGLFLGSVAVSFLISRLGRRALIYAGIVIAVHLLYRLLGDADSANAGRFWCRALYRCRCRRFGSPLKASRSL